MYLKMGYAWNQAFRNNCQFKQLRVIWGGQRDSNPRMHESQSCVFGRFTMATIKILKPAQCWLFYFGGAEQDRTVDLLNAIQALSQLSYSPTKGYEISIPSSFEVLMYTLHGGFMSIINYKIINSHNYCFCYVELII